MRSPTPPRKQSSRIERQERCGPVPDHHLAGTEPIPGATTDHALAWVSLDEGDRNVASLWTYVVTALDRACPGVGAGALPLLQAGQTPTEAVLTTVLNKLSVL